jgi:hypothetical protein
MRARPRCLLASALGFALLSWASASGAAIIATQKSSTPHPGVTLVEGTTRAPSSRFFATKVALCTAGVRVDATAPPSSFRTVPAWAQSVGAEVAVNGDFFRPELRVQGIAVGGGKTWPITRTGIDPAVADEFYYERFGWIAFGPDFVDFTHTEHVKANAAKFGATQGYSPRKVVHTYPKGTVALVSGFPELVTEGKRYACSSPTATTCFPDRSDMRARHPRTAMGLSADRRTFILVAVDGRTTTSAGMYGTELAELMSELGAWQAFNLDGGGSTEMWIKGRGTVNRPSDGSSRAVANHWGIFTGNAGPGAHCMPAPPAGDAGAETEGGASGDAGAGSDGRDPAAVAETEGGGEEGASRASPEGDDLGGDGEGCAQASSLRGSRGSHGSHGSSLEGAAVLAACALAFARLRGRIRARRRI